MNDNIKKNNNNEGCLTNKFNLRVIVKCFILNNFLLKTQKTNKMFSCKIIYIKQIILKNLKFVENFFFF